MFPWFKCRVFYQPNVSIVPPVSKTSFLRLPAMRFVDRVHQKTLTSMYLKTEVLRGREFRVNECTRDSNYVFKVIRTCSVSNLNLPFKDIFVVSSFDQIRSDFLSGIFGCCCRRWLKINKVDWSSQSLRTFYSFWQTYFMHLLPQRDRLISHKTQRTQ